MIVAIRIPNQTRFFKGWAKRLIPFGNPASVPGTTLTTSNIDKAKDLSSIMAARLVARLTEGGVDARAVDKPGMPLIVEDFYVDEVTSSLASTLVVDASFFNLYPPPSA